MKYMPHGMCWFWDWKVLLLHNPADLLTFLAYSIIALTGLYAYKKGKLGKITVTYPKLWILGVLFVGTCGFSHLGNFLETWVGGILYYFTGANKIVMATVSLWFAIEFWSVRNDIVTVGLVIAEIHRLEEVKEKEIIAGL